MNKDIYSGTRMIQEDCQDVGRIVWGIRGKSLKTSVIIMAQGAANPFITKNTKHINTSNLIPVGYVFGSNFGIHFSTVGMKN